MVDQARPGSLSARLAATTRLLVVEDDPDIADFLRAYFRASGYDVVHVDPTSADEALAAVREHKPDCILLDLWLRGWSGLQLYRRLRSDDEYDLTPVIVLTADVASRPRTEPMATGVDAFVAKPFGADELGELVAGRIAGARELARRGVVDPVSGAMSSSMLDARIAAELEVAEAAGEPLTFGLVTLRSRKELHASIGDEGLGWVVRQLVDVVRPALPDSAVIGRSDAAELAVLLPGLPSWESCQVLQSALGQARGVRALPGGGDVRTDPAAGIATWPEHASAAAGLFMAADAALADALAGDDLVVVAR